MAERVAATAKASEAKKTCSNSCKQKSSFNSSVSPADRILQFQRTAGNQAVQKLIKSGALQTNCSLRLQRQEHKTAPQYPSTHPDQPVVAQMVTLTTKEQNLLSNWITYGRVGLEEKLTGQTEHDLDVLSRALVTLRASLIYGGKEPLLSLETEYTLRAQREYNLLRDGPVKQQYENWFSSLNESLGLLRGALRKNDEISIKHMFWLYARNGIVTWPSWYHTQIDNNVTFLGAKVVSGYGIHKRAVPALKKAEAQLMSFWPPGGRGLGNCRIAGYNARGWSGQLGGHDLGLAFDMDSRFNIEVLGAPGIAWATFPGGLDRIAITKLFTGFDLLSFARNRSARFVQTAEGTRPIDLASEASSKIGNIIAEEITQVENIPARNEQKWKPHREELLQKARRHNVYPLWGVVRKPTATEPRLTSLEVEGWKGLLTRISSRESWLVFLRTLLSSPKWPDVATIMPQSQNRRGFFNIPPEVVQALVEAGFHWVPFHHFELRIAKEVLAADASMFYPMPVPTRRRAPSLKLHR